MVRAARNRTHPAANRQFLPYTRIRLTSLPRSRATIRHPVDGVIYRRRRKNGEKKNAPSSRPFKSACRQVPRAPTHNVTRFPPWLCRDARPMGLTTTTCITNEYSRAFACALTKSKQMPASLFLGRAQPQGHPALPASPSQEGWPAGDVPKPPPEAEGQQEQGVVPRRRPRRDQAPNLEGLLPITKDTSLVFEGRFSVLLKTSTRSSTWR